MSKHGELIERLRWVDRPTCNEAADALEAQAREIADMQQQESELCTLHAMAEAECKKLRAEIEALKEQMASTTKSAFEAMPHDIPRRMKRKICVETGWSMSMVSRAYIEMRAAFTGEKYTANEELDAALTALGKLEMENADLRRCLEDEPWPVKHVAKSAKPTTA